MPGHRRGLILALPAVGAAVIAAMASAPVLASACATGYVSQLRQVRDELVAGEPIPAALAQLQALAAVDAAPALQPVITDLQSGRAADAQRLLDTTITTIGAPARSGCGGETGAQRQALSGVYRSPAFANLDAPVSPSWIEQLASAIGSGLTTLGPVGSAVLASLVLALVVAFAAWRLRQVMAGGRQVRVAEASTPSGTDPEVEWAGAMDAAGRGEFRQAIRHAFRSVLVSLAQRGRLAVQPTWTTPELLVHAGADPELAAELGPAAAGFDRAWYSEAPVDAGGWEEVRRHCQAIRALTGGGHRGGPRPLLRRASSGRSSSPGAG